jgi:hypothetical protein
MGKTFARNQAAIGNGAVEDGCGGRKDMRPQLGVDAVGGNHYLGLGCGAVLEFHPSQASILIEADGAVAGMDDTRGQVGCK